MASIAVHGTCSDRPLIIWMNLPSLWTSQQGAKQCASNTEIYFRKHQDLFTLWTISQQWEGTGSLKLKSHPGLFAYSNFSTWVRSWRSGCLATWFCYQLIAKPGNKNAAPPWPDPYVETNEVCFSLNNTESWIYSKHFFASCSTSIWRHYHHLEKWLSFGELNSQLNHNFNTYCTGPGLTIKSLI